MPFSRLGGGGGSAPMVPAVNLTQMLGGDAGANGNGLSTLMGMMGLLRTIQSMGPRQQLMELRRQKLMEDLIYGRGKERTENLNKERMKIAGLQLLQNPEFTEDMRKLVNYSPTKRLKELQMIRAKYIDPLSAQNEGVDSSALYKAMLGQYETKARLDQKNIDEDAWDSTIANLQMSGNNLLATIKGFLPGYDKTEEVRKAMAENQIIRDQHPYLLDQAQRQQEGESFWGRTNGLAGWANVAAEQAPTIASFMVPRTLAVKGAALLGRMGLGALANPVTQYAIGRGVSVGTGAALGAGLADTGYVGQVLSSGKSEAEQQEALSSPQRVATNIIGGALGAIAPNPYGAYRSIATRLSPAYRAATPEARRFMLNTQPAIDLSRQAFVPSTLSGALNVGLGMGAMGGAQQIANNALINSALGTDTPVTEGALDAFISGALSGAVIGGAARAGAKVKMPYLNDQGLPRRSLAFHVEQYNKANTDNERQQLMTQLATDYPNNKNIVNQLAAASHINDPVERYKMEQWYNNKPIEPKKVSELLASRVVNNVDSALVEKSKSSDQEISDIRTDTGLVTHYVEAANPVDAPIGPYNPNITYNSVYRDLNTFIDNVVTGNNGLLTKHDEVSVVKHLHAYIHARAMEGGGTDYSGNNGLSAYYPTQNSDSYNLIKDVIDRIYVERLHPQLSNLFSNIKNIIKTSKIKSELDHAFPVTELDKASTASLTQLSSALKSLVHANAPLENTVKAKKGILDWVTNNVDRRINERAANPDPSQNLIDNYADLSNKFSNIATPDLAAYNQLMDSFPAFKSMLEAEALVNNNARLEDLNAADLQTLISNTLNNRQTQLEDLIRNNLRNVDPSAIDPDSAVSNRYSTTGSSNEELTTENATRDLNSVFNNLESTNRLSSSDEEIFKLIVNNSQYKNSFDILKATYDNANGVNTFSNLPLKEQVARYSAFLRRSQNMDDILNSSTRMCQ